MHVLNTEYCIHSNRRPCPNRRPPVHHQALGTQKWVKLIIFRMDHGVFGVKFRTFLYQTQNSNTSFKHLQSDRACSVASIFANITATRQHAEILHWLMYDRNFFPTDCGTYICDQSMLTLPDLKVFGQLCSLMQESHSVGHYDTCKPSPGPGTRHFVM